MAAGTDGDDAGEALAHVFQQRSALPAGAPAGSAAPSGTTAAMPPAGIEAKTEVKVASLPAGLRLPPAAAGRLVAAIWEAVTNAIEHGRTPAPCVDIRLSPVGDEVIAAVSDHGPGFDPGAVSDPPAAQHRLRPGGRGLFLIRCYTDNVDCTFPPQGGTVVTLRTGIPRSRA